MPTLIYVARQSDKDAALSMSLVMLVVSVGVLVALRDLRLGAPVTAAPGSTAGGGLPVADRVDAAFTAEPGEVLAVIGPDGAGRAACCTPWPGSSTSRAPRASATPTCPPSRPRATGRDRFQGQLLFPHLSALDKVAFGVRRAARTSRPRRPSRATGRTVRHGRARGPQAARASGG